MGTTHSRPLELIHEEFSRTLDSGDIECALDLMAMAALAAWNTPTQTERLQLLHLVRTGIIRPEGADIRRDEEFEAVALRFVVDAVGPLASALSPEVGASKARRRGWVDAWQRLSWFHPSASSAAAVSNFYRAVDDYVFDDPSDGQAEVGFAALANHVEQEFANDGILSRAPDAESTRAPRTGTGMADDEGFEDPRLIDEFESFVEGRETAEALNLLAIAVFYTEYVGVDEDDQTVAELLARSASLIGDAWDDTTDLRKLLSRLWVSAYTELVAEFEDEDLEDLGLPEFESEFPPLSETQQQTWQSSIEEQEARQPLETTQVEDDGQDDDADEDAPADEADDDALEDESELGGPLVLKAPLVAMALYHLDRTCGPSRSNALALASVDAGQRAWASHATITGSWKGSPPSKPGYGGRIRADLARWAAATAAEMFPVPVDKRPIPQKRGRRIYEYLWVWAITAGSLAAIAGVHEGFWWAVGVGALIGYVLSLNYDSLTPPRLAQLPDPNAERRANLEKALIDAGLHVAHQYDSAAYSLDLSPAALKQMVKGAWQPQGAPPPRMPSCTHREAEYVAAHWMRYLGATSCTVTQASRDGGIDIVSDTHVAEVKHHQSPVGVSFIRQIYGAATGASKRAAFFSLNGYTVAAQEFANANSIALFRYDPQNRTLTANSRGAQFALQHGLHAEMTANSVNR